MCKTVACFYSQWLYLAFLCQWKVELCIGLLQPLDTLSPKFSYTKACLRDEYGESCAVLFLPFALYSLSRVLHCSSRKDLRQY